MTTDDTDDTAHAQDSTLAARWALPCLIQMGMLLEAEPTCILIQHRLQYVTVALIYSTLAIRYNADCMITCAFRVFDLH